MDKGTMISGVLLFLAGVTALVYGAFSSRDLPVHIYWSLVLIAGLVLAVSSARKK